MATDKLFYNYSLRYPASVLRLLKIKDYDEYKAVSYSIKHIECHPDIVFENLYGEKRVIFLEYQGYPDEWIFHRLLTGMLLYCQERQYAGVTGRIHCPPNQENKFKRSQ